MKIILEASSNEQCQMASILENKKRLTSIHKEIKRDQNGCV